MKDLGIRAPGGNKPGLLTLTIKDKSALYLAYMPFVKNGNQKAFQVLFTIFFKLLG